ncbi:MAG TPA: hypothetical protein VNC79_13735, partial [Mycobacteriales bacterium]|nr:hypothetical protein [Mycobacteriales bacterium]
EQVEHGQIPTSRNVSLIAAATEAEAAGTEAVAPVGRTPADSTDGTAAGPTVAGAERADEAAARRDSEEQA